LRKGILQALKFLGFLSAGIVLLWLAFRNIDFRSLSEGLRGANYSWILLSLLFALIAYVSRARRWILLVRSLGHNPSLINTFHAVMTGYLANLALPRLGELTRCIALGKKEKIPADQLFGTVVIERTIDLISLLIIMVIMVLLSGDAIALFLKESIFGPLQEKVFSVLDFKWIIWVLLGTASAAGLIMLVRYRRNLKKIRIIAKIFDLIRGIFHGLRTITTLKRKGEFIFHTVFIWINYTLMTWVVVFALESTSHITLGESVFLLVIGGLAMSAPVQSGLGAFHYIISRGLAFVEGLRIEDGLVYAILTHESQLLLVALIGTFSFYIIFRKSSPAEPSADG